MVRVDTPDVVGFQHLEYSASNQASGDATASSQWKRNNLDPAIVDGLNAVTVHDRRAYALVQAQQHAQLTAAGDDFHRRLALFQGELFPPPPLTALRDKEWRCLTAAGGTPRLGVWTRHAQSAQTPPLVREGPGGERCVRRCSLFPIPVPLPQS
jgi:hypothetical protein